MFHHVLFAFPAGIEQTTADHTTLVIKATRDGKLDITSNSFKDDSSATIP